MLEKSKQNEVKGSISYQFTASPLNLMYVLDSHCFKMLNLLIQEESYWKSKGKLVDGYFFKSLNDLKEDMFRANEQDVRLTLEALYVNGLIDIIPQGDQMKASKFKINLEKIIEIDQISILDVKKFFPRIIKLKRGSKCTYVERKDFVSEQGVLMTSTNCTPDCITDCNTDSTSDCTPKLYNVDKVNNQNKKNENNIIDNNIINNDKVQVEVEKDSINSKLVSKEMIDKPNGSQVIDASATRATAQSEVLTKGEVTNEDKLAIKLKTDLNRLEAQEFYKSLDSYSIDELKHAQWLVQCVDMDLRGIDIYNIKYYTERAIRKKNAS